MTSFQIKWDLCIYTFGRKETGGPQAHLESNDENKRLLNRKLKTSFDLRAPRYNAHTLASVRCANRHDNKK